MLVYSPHNLPVFTLPILPKNVPAFSLAVIPSRRNISDAC